LSSGRLPLQLDRRRGLRRLGQAEVEDLDRPVLGDLDVGGLEIPVDDALFVGGLEPFGYLDSRRIG
jgi:hypothetical protein